MFEEFFSPVTAAQTLLHTSVSKRKEVLQKTMGIIMQVLATTPLDPRHKAGAMHMVGAVAEILLTVSPNRRDLVSYLWFGGPSAGSLEIFHDRTLSLVGIIGDVSMLEVS